MTSAHLAEALREVRERMAEACRRARRAPDAVTLVAVSKTFPAERVRALYDCGQRLFGENRVQEALAKIGEAGAGPRWHLVGHLQRNKAKQAVGAFELIHSVDSEPLAAELAQRAAAANVVQPILVEVNVAGEGTKSGVAPSQAGALLDAVADLPGLKLRGLMCVPPVVALAEEARPWFARLRELRDAQEKLLGVSLPELSMGMSDDFEVAIEEGATIVRIGRALFGSR